MFEKLYADAIKRGRKTLDQVPENLREAVKALLEADAAVTSNGDSTAPDKKKGQDAPQEPPQEAETDAPQKTESVEPEAEPEKTVKKSSKKTATAENE